MRIIALGTSSFLMSVVEGLADSGHEIICLVSQPTKSLPVNSVNIKKHSRSLNINYFEIENINSDESINYLKALEPELIFSAWPKLIKKEVLLIPKHGVIGSHPTSLPYNRGRHPLHWEIVLKIKKSMLSFFIMDEGLDSGRILLQKPYNIYSGDNIKSLSIRIDKLAVKASRELGVLLHEKTFPIGKVQNHKVSNTWRKRTLYDVTIDFRMNGNNIISLVKSFTEPFSYAMICNQDKVLYITDAYKTPKEALPNNVDNIEPGKILYMEEKLLRVKTSDSVVDFLLLDKLDSKIKMQKYLHPPIKYLIENPSLKKYYI